MSMDTRTQKIISDLLLEIGIRDDYIGYAYIVKAVDICLKDPQTVYSITKKLYPAIASEFSSSNAKVERGIHRAIEAAWDCGNPDTLYALFRNTIDPDKAKPTNSHFIARIVNIVRERIGK